MAVRVRVPTTLRQLTDGAGEVEVEGHDVQAVFAALESAFPGFAERLVDDTGRLRAYVNVFVGEGDIGARQGLDTLVAPGETVAIVPAVAGG